MDALIQFFRKLLGLPVLASQHGREVDAFIVYVHWLMLALFVGWLAYFVYVLVRFRQSRHPRADYHGVRNHASSYLEGMVVLIEGVLLLGFAIPLWAKMAGANQFPRESESTVIHVVAQQFAWNVRYPGLDGKFGRQDFQRVNAGNNPLGLDPDDPAGRDDVSTLNEVHVPVNKPVIVQLTSKDVIHSFKIIAMRVTQDAIPGLRIPTHFTPTQEGVYQINCAQLCGNGHAAMAAGRLIVESEETYRQWLAARSKSAAGATQSFE
jgi:cytochrome c oxidase subunit II